MSFVLEALRKQEAATDPDAAVSLARHQAAHRRHRLWKSLFGVAALLNVGLLFWTLGLPYLQRSDAPAPVPVPKENIETAEAESASARAPVRAEEEAARLSARDDPQALAQAEPSAGAATAYGSGGAAGTARASGTAPLPASASAAGTAPLPEGAVSEKASERSTLDELPASVRARFPGLAFSTHIYSEDPELRAVVANGTRLEEGDRIRGVAIEEITERGVVIAFESFLVEVPLAVDWDAL